MDVEVKNESAEPQRYTVQYADTTGKISVETFDLAPDKEKEFKNVMEGSWKVLKIETVKQ